MLVIWWTGGPHNCPVGRHRTHTPTGGGRLQPPSCLCICICIVHPSPSCTRGHALREVSRAGGGCCVPVVLPPRAPPLGDLTVRIRAPWHDAVPPTFLFVNIAICIHPSTTTTPTRPSIACCTVTLHTHPECKANADTVPSLHVYQSNCPRTFIFLPATLARVNAIVFPAPRAHAHRLFQTSIISPPTLTHRYHLPPV